MEILLSWKRKWKQWRGFIRELKRHGIDFYDRNQPDFGTEDGIRQLIEQIALSVNSGYSAHLMKVQAQINALNSQINPHFLYNTLEMIRSQALIQGAEDVAEMAETLSLMFRYSISKGDNLVTFREEMENLERYFTIQQYRFPNRFTLEKIFPDSEEIMNCRIPKLTLQPLIENAVYHGLEKKLGKGTITVRAFTVGKRLTIRVHDDGEGIAPERLEELQKAIEMGISYVYTDKRSKGNGVALINVNQRIQLQFGREYGLSISSVLHKGTIVELTLPVEYEECPVS